MFKKYQHIERFGTPEVDGLTQGNTYIFPKIDGTNSSVWLENGEIHAGSRKRELSLDVDNANFYNTIKDDARIKAFFNDNPTLRLFGEWLVPHTLKNYETTAWKKFYVFDVVDCTEADTADNIEKSRYLPYEEYSELLDKYNIDYVPLIKKLENPTVEEVTDCIDLNGFLTTDGKGEGIVIKNYEYQNRYGRQTWAKIVTAEFKTKHTNHGGGGIKKALLIGDYEQAIVEEYVTEALVEKEYSKIINDTPDIPRNKLIPQLFARVYYSLITEESWHFIKKYKNPKIDYKVLYKLLVDKVKELKIELF